jgi:ribosomal protein L37E
VLDWIVQQPLRREWFFEQRDGNCRLMASFTARLSETAPVWARAVAPFAEWIARQLWSANRKGARDIASPTRLTQRHKREAKGAPSFPPAEHVPRAKNRCRGCGKIIRDVRTQCAQCAVPNATQRLIDAHELADWLRILLKPGPKKVRRNEGMRRLALHGDRPRNQPRLPRKCIRRKFSHYSPEFRTQPLHRPLEYLAGMQVAFAVATSPIQGTGRRLRSWLAFPKSV